MDIQILHDKVDVSSSWIASIEYVSIEDLGEKDSGVILKTKTGSSYFYEMDENDYFEWIGSPSKGKWYNENIDTKGTKL